ncbi:MAG: ketol-acid reductoisomerase [Candidatus Buchananbacteria bacterium RIFCSPHIGHO2_01_FULL_44_11]|uniref:Acetohydroxy-acid isomeroreductase n=1 Tax=Candidatus Buchananbacteria bacterium RIFCSPHIGHO2_01_FULL_44_11 TaxID=1797535 RepID=A0A1G1Y1N2_9BACT|nr:MAG: ketol-acid reductoisomerase [Candidatus Buchananbacteria bacterium RIFCSPHIGHO2_01_FULL_44_11]
MDLAIQSQVFVPELVDLGGSQEWIIRGGRDKFPLLPAAFKDIRQIGVIGWGSQAPAQAQNLRDSLKGTGIRVKVGLQAESQSIPKAIAAGFTFEDGTLGEMFKVIRESDLVLLLISDAAQVELCIHVFSAIRPGATLGFSHGFLVGHMKSVGARWPRDINVIGVCPKGMGPSVRRLYLQGQEVNGAGINSSFAVDQDIDGRATDIALGWALAIGSPFVFQTTLEKEYLSDLVGERSILLGAVYGIVEALFRRSVLANSGPETAFINSVVAITDQISPLISRQGILAVFESLGDQRPTFLKIYANVYPLAQALLAEIYEEVASGNEISSVIMAGERLKRIPMTKIGNTPMWLIGQGMRDRGITCPQDIPVVTAAVYIAVMMAQIDLLMVKGHCVSEICNESVIEAVDSLNPFMRARGVSWMVDNCSRTARLGTRKWGPRWQYAVEEALAAYDAGEVGDVQAARQFGIHLIHGALATCAQFRPPVDIAVS